MSPGLVGAARLFAAFGAVAVDEEGWGAGCRVVDVAAGAASGGHDYVGVGFMDSLAFQRERDQFNHAIKLNPAIISCHVTSYNGLQPDRKPPHSFFHLRPRREAIIRIPYFHGVASPPPNCRYSSASKRSASPLKNRDDIIAAGSPAPCAQQPPSNSRIAHSVSS